MTKNEQLLEAILFSRGEEVSRKELSKLLSIDEHVLKDIVGALRSGLSDTGLSVIETDDGIALVTSPLVGEDMRRIREEELSGPLSKGALETLTIILYRSPITKTDIDYLRGVNSATMLRNLLVRGLIERNEDPKDKRSFVYKPAVRLLAHMGMTKVEDLPEFKDLNELVEKASVGNKTEDATENKE